MKFTFNFNIVKVNKKHACFVCLSVYKLANESEMKFRVIGAFKNRSRLLRFLSTRPHRQPAISSVTFRGSHSLASLLAYNPNELSILPDSPNIRSPAADNSKATNNSHRSEGQNAFRFAWRIRSSASLTFLAISSQLPFPRTTYPEATQTANQPC